MKAILRDSKGWSKVMNIPSAMYEIRLPLHRKTTMVFEHQDATYVSKDKSPELVIFRLSGKGLGDSVYYDEYIPRSVQGE